MEIRKRTFTRLIIFALLILTACSTASPNGNPSTHDNSADFTGNLPVEIDEKKNTP